MIQAEVSPTILQLLPRCSLEPAPGLQIEHETMYFQLQPNNSETGNKYDKTKDRFHVEPVDIFNSKTIISTSSLNDMFDKND